MFRTVLRYAPAARLAALAVVGLSAAAAMGQSGGQSNQPIAVPVPDSALGPASRPPAAAPAAAPGPSSSAPAAPQPSAASTSVPIPVIMVVSFEEVLHESKAYKSIKGQDAVLREGAQKEIGQKKSEIDTAIQEFQRDARSGTIPADQIEDKRHALQLRQDGLQKEVDQRLEALRTAEGDAVQKVQQAFFEVIRGLAAERRANLVLDKVVAIPIDPAFDASREALARLDARISQVTVVLAQTAAAPSGPAPAASPAAAQPPKKK